MTSVLNPDTSAPPVGTQPKFPLVPYTVPSAYFEDYGQELMHAWKTLDFAEFDRAGSPERKAAFARFQAPGRTSTQMS